MEIGQSAPLPHFKLHHYQTAGHIVLVFRVHYNLGLLSKEPSGGRFVRAFQGGKLHEPAWFGADYTGGAGSSV